MIPRLIHPIPVVIEVLDTGETSWDPDALEPIGDADRSTQVSIEAQIQWRDDRDPKATRGGIRLESDGYIIVRPEDEALLAAPIKRGDKIIQIGSDAYELYILGFEPAGHYPDVGGPGLRLLYFGSRGPSDSG